MNKRWTAGRLVPCPRQRLTRPPDASPTLWLTGLNGAGRTTLVQTLSRALNEHGRRRVVLEGDTLRSGLNRDLGFHAQREHPPCRRGRPVHERCGPDRRCDIDLALFTGVSSPYEAPEAPRLAINPMRTGLQPAVNELPALIKDAKR